MTAAVVQVLERSVTWLRELATALRTTAADPALPWPASVQLVGVLLVDLFLVLVVVLAVHQIVQARRQRRHATRAHQVSAGPVPQHAPAAAAPQHGALELQVWLDIDGDGVADYRQAWFWRGLLNVIAWVGVTFFDEVTVFHKLAAAYRGDVKPGLEAWEP